MPKKNYFFVEQTTLHDPDYRFQGTRNEIRSSLYKTFTKTFCFCSQRTIRFLGIVFPFWRRPSLNPFRSHKATLSLGLRCFFYPSHVRSRPARPTAPPCVFTTRNINIAESTYQSQTPPPLASPFTCWRQFESSDLLNNRLPCSRSYEAGPLSKALHSLQMWIKPRQLFLKTGGGLQAHIPKWGSQHRKQDVHTTPSRLSVPQHPQLIQYQSINILLSSKHRKKHSFLGFHGNITSPSETAERLWPKCSLIVCLAVCHFRFSF
jgi:hypothetical protein